MKKVVFLFLFFVLSICNVYANDESSSIDIAIDVSYLDPLINNIIYNEITPSIKISSDLSIRLPINFIIPREKNLDLIGIGTSIDVLYRPFFNNLFISFSMIKVEWLLGLDAPFENINYLNKLSFGYTFYIKDKLFIEPSISFFNLNGIYEESITILKNNLVGFPTTRFSLLVGYQLFNINATEGGKI